jgi:hypothetical protein
MLATVVKRTPYGNERADMASVQSLANRQNIIRVGIVILVLVILGGVIFNGTRSRSQTDEGASSLGSCVDLQNDEIARSENLLRASLSGTITAAVAELEDVQSEQSEKDAERSLKEMELETNQKALEKATDARTAKQKELADQEGDLEDATDDLADKNEDLRNAEQDNEPQEDIDKLTSDIADLDSKMARIAVIISTRNEQIAALSEEVGSLTEAITTLKVDIGTLDNEMASLARREAALEATIEAKYLARSAMLSTDTRKAEIADAQADLDSSKAELLEVEATGAGRSRRDAILGHMGVLDLKIATLIEPVWALDAESNDGISGAYLPPRSDVNLVAAVPVSRINLGSHRETSMVEVVLTSATFGASEESSTEAVESGAAVAPNVELPDKAQYFTEASLFRRSEGNTVPANQIFVWSRRVGTAVIMSVCVEPHGLDPGLYAGEVYLVDPSLNPARISVELTAQSRWLNWLYSLLIIVPTLALAYVWITARYSAGQDPWESSHWWTWFKQNSVAVLVVGFAAVWATLQVPFNNRTWGASWLTSAAVIGVGLVAAVTAMTVVAGRVVPEVHSDEPAGDEVVAETGEATEDDA